MRRLAAALVALLVVELVLRAAPLAHADGPFDLQAATRLAEARERTRVGIGLTSAGLVLQGLSLSLWASALVMGFGRAGSEPYTPDPPAFWPLFITAAATTVLAPLFIVPGSYLWSSGRRRERAISLTADGALHF